MTNVNENNKKVWINTMQPLNFYTAKEITYTSTTELARKMNFMFKNTFSDCEGCTLVSDGVNKLELLVYFNHAVDNGVDKIKGIEPVQKAKARSIAEQLNNFGPRFSKNAFELTQDAKDILSRFVMGNRNNINWNSYVREQTLQQGYKQSIVVVIQGLSVISVIEQLFGRFIDNERVEYAVFIEKALGYSIGGTTSNYQIRIERAYVENAKLIGEQLGVLQNETIPMIKDMSID